MLGTGTASRMVPDSCAITPAEPARPREARAAAGTRS